MLGASAINAAAADLGGLMAGQLFTYGDDVTIDLPDPPGPLAGDDFTDCHGLLDTRQDSQGNEWTDHGGRWQCLGNGVVRSQMRLPLAHASVDVARSDDLVVTTSVSDVSNQQARSGPGIALFTDGSSHMYVIYERDEGRVTLGKSSPWANTGLQGVSVSDRESLAISVVIDQPRLTVLVDGSVVMTYDLSTLPANEQALFLSKTRFGLESDLDNQSRFDTFTIETLP